MQLALKGQLALLVLKARRVKLGLKALPVQLAQLAQQAQMVVMVLPQPSLLERFQLGQRVQAQR